MSAVALKPVISACLGSLPLLAPVHTCICLRFHRSTPLWACLTTCPSARSSQSSRCDSEQLVTAPPAFPVTLKTLAPVPLALTRLVG